MIDVLIIGGGIVGCSLARELSKYKLDICVLEKENDVSLGTSKANSGIVHAGFDAKENSLKAKYNIRGNELIRQLHKTLDFHFKQNGAYVLCFDKNDIDELNALKIRGEKNGVTDLSIMSGDEIRKIEPNVSKNVVAGLHAKTSGVVCPYDMTIAFAENAVDNGVSFKFNSKVTKIEKLADGFKVFSTNKKEYTCRVLVNCAGLFSDEINDMLSVDKCCISPRKGEYCLLDRSSGSICSGTMFQLPTKMGKGVLVTPTADGNILIGPNANDIDDKEDVSTTKDGISDIVEKSKLSIPNLNMRDIITQFSGLRSTLQDGTDFIVGKSSIDNYFVAIGIESPGLTSAPAIAESLTKDITKYLNAVKKDNFIEKRVGIKRFIDMTEEEKTESIKTNPLYGKIVCRCESVSEAEIVQALHSLIPAVDMDGIKRRTRSQLGRCQSGFCAPLILEIIAREKGINLTDVEKSHGETVLKFRNKEGI